MGATEASEIEKLKQVKELEVKKIIKQHQTADTYLDLVAKSLYAVPEEIFRFPNLEFLYLESNHLDELPEDLFENLPMLKWLDLRDNKLEYLPAGIGIHRNLKNILLERNQLTHLPPELGNVTSITGLSLRGNPLVTPPPEIIEQGVQVILSYLLDVLNASGGMQEHDEEMEWGFDNEAVNESSDDEEERLSTQSVNSEINYQPHELSRHGPTPIPAMFHQHEARISPWRGKRINGTSSARVKVKDITLSTNGRQSEQMDRKDWLAKMHEKKQNTRVLDDWRREAKILQKLLVPKSRNELDKTRPQPPYGVDGPSEGRPVTKEERQIHFGAVEERVDLVDPKRPKPKDEEVIAEEDDLDTPKQIKTLAKMTHLAMGVVKSIADRSKSVSETPVPAVNVTANEALVEKQTRDDTEQKERLNQSNSLHRDRERIDNKVQARIRQHTTQLRTNKQKDDSKKTLFHPGRELQRELLDQKMSNNQQGLEYRFRAFTGDSSSFSSSKKTSSM